MKIFLILLCLFLGTLSIAAPDSGFDLVSGKNIKFDIENKQKFKVVLFYSSSCPCSQSHFDHLNALSKSFSNFEFFGFHANKYVDISEAKTYFSKLKTNFPIIQDSELKYTEKLKALKTPHAFVFDRENRLVYQGGVTDSRDAGSAEKFYLKEVLASLSKGESSPYQEVKTLGCYIRR